MANMYSVCFRFLFIQATFITLAIFAVEVHSLDLTLVPYSNGHDVVRAVIAKITFSNLSFLPESSKVAPFMRTMAYVETRDGTLLNPTGGGIWNISEALFDHVMQDRRDEYEAIIEELARDYPTNYIQLKDWDNLTYSDLDVPMYSGLVARVLIHLNNDTLLVGSLSRYWASVFHRTGMESQWVRDTQVLANVEDCRVVTDLMFVVDGSGSINALNFEQVRRFVYNFSLEIIPRLSLRGIMTSSRLGIITFNETARQYIALNATHEQQDLLQLIQDIPYYGGFTNTGAGLELMRQQEWRSDVSVLRLAIVVSDGESNRGVDVEIASEAVHNHFPSIVVYAIGVGEGADEEELQAIASRADTLSHLDFFSSSDFASVTESYSYQICFTEYKEVDQSKVEGGSLDRDSVLRLRFEASVTNGLTFRICIRQGRITVYASTTPIPSSAQYGWRGEVSDDLTFLPCLTMFYDILGESDNVARDNDGQRMKRQLIDPPSDSIPFYVTLEGLNDINIFTFNSSEGNVTQDVNECEDNPCDQNTRCINTDGSFFCLDKNTCGDIVCDPNAECSNSDDHYFCTCSEGYTGNGLVCSRAIDGSVITAIVISVLLVALLLGIALPFAISLIAILWHKRAKEKEKGDEKDLIDHESLDSGVTESQNGKGNIKEPTNSNSNDDGLLDLDVDMFAPQPHGPDRFVPSMVKKFEELAIKS